jgi:acyl carrier protein
MATGADLEEQIDIALREVLGYVPADEEDLSTAIDSMQKLELLIAFEESLLIPFDDEVMGAEWWASRHGIVTYANEARRLSA